MGETFAGIVSTGPLLLGIAVAAIAGLVSFLSPCVLPLVPGYLAYITGLTGADTQAEQREVAGVRAGSGGVAQDQRTTVRTAARSRVLTGGLLFVLGFGAVFVTIGVLAASAGRLLREHDRWLEIGGGLLMILFGLALLGLVPGMQREFRSRWLPTAGLAGAPLFGAVFALSWIPCIGPTIGAVLALGAVGGEPARAAVLATAYTLGLGLPFLAFGSGLRWVTRAVAVVRRHTVWVTRAGAAMLAAVGLALLTGAWGEFILWLRGAIVGFEVVL